MEEEDNLCSRAGCLEGRGLFFKLWPAPMFSGLSSRESGNEKMKTEIVAFTLKYLEKFCPAA